MGRPRDLAATRSWCVFPVCGRKRRAVFGRVRSESSSPFALRVVLRHLPLAELGRELSGRRGILREEQDPRRDPIEPVDAVQSTRVGKRGVRTSLLLPDQGQHPELARGGIVVVGDAGRLRDGEEPLALVEDREVDNEGRRAPSQEDRPCGEQRQPA
ncbi:hypothetical protein ACHAWF_014153 [Thalassiosira exigua]